MYFFIKKIVLQTMNSPIWIHKIRIVDQNQINRNILLVCTGAFEMCRRPLCIKQRSATKQTHKAISTSWSMEPANCTRLPCLQGENFANNRITHKEDVVGNFRTFQFRWRLFWAVRVFVCILLASSNFARLFIPGSISDCAKWLIDSVNSKVMKARFSTSKGKARWKFAEMCAGGAKLEIVL